MLSADEIKPRIELRQKADKIPEAGKTDYGNNAPS
jgi:hypothetical protein